MMRRIVVALLLALLLHSGAWAQKFVIELEGFVFDRQLSDAQQKQIEDAVKDLPPQERTAAMAEERIQTLRLTAKEVVHFKTRSLAALNETASQTLEGDRMSLIGHVKPLEVKDDWCKLECRVAFSYIVGERFAHSAESHTNSAIHFGPWNEIGRSSGKSTDKTGRLLYSYEELMRLRVREATDEDLELPEIPKDFHLEFLKKHKLLLPSGGKLTTQ